MKASLSGALAALVLLLPACAAEPKLAPYGQPVRFAKNRVIEFHDFTVRYLGQRRVSSPVFKPGFLYYDFEVAGRGGPQTVSWSSGTGVIDAASFKVDGRPYELELKATVARKGWMRDDEMVVWPEADFQKAARVRR
jgi:hypothetical protein